MNRLVVPVVACVVAGLVAPIAPAAPAAPVAHAATMADLYDPYFDTKPTVVGNVASDYYSTTAVYPLQGAPEGATIDYRGQQRTKLPIHLELQGTDMHVRLSGSRVNPPVRGENTDDIRIWVKYPDGSEEVVTSTVTLIPPHEYLYKPHYDETVANPGERFTAEPYNRMPGSLADDATWTLTGNTSAWAATIDPKTGVVTGTVPTDTRRSTEFRATATFVDGTKQEVSVPVVNTGKGVVDQAPTQPSGPAQPETPDQPTGSTPLQITALVIGVLALVGGLAALALPYLPL